MKVKNVMWRIVDPVVVVESVRLRTLCGGSAPVVRRAQVLLPAGGRLSNHREYSSVTRSFIAMAGIGVAQTVPRHMAVTQRSAGTKAMCAWCLSILKIVGFSSI